jgi:acyl-CoA reductase-like NAD-dependent aldehyde dehydrogenase
LPPGVVNVVSGTDELGAWLTAHPLIRKIAFTGSTDTGKRVALAAAQDLKRVTLELGGNDAAIILDDADPAKIAEGVFWGAFNNAGQICTAIKRLYVPESLFTETVDALAAIAEKVVVGNGADEGTQLGPLTNEMQRNKVARLVADALNSGGRAVTGGAPSEGPGYFYRPTIVTGVEDGTPLVDEEQFGPALPVIAYRSLDDAVARANASPYGLGASVWTDDLDRARQVVARLETGMAWVNSHVAVSPSQPFGGIKNSGIGVENGPWGVDAFIERQMVHEARQ